MGAIRTPMPRFNWPENDVLAEAERAMTEQKWEQARCWLLYATTMDQLLRSKTADERGREHLELARELTSDLVAMAAFVEHIAALADPEVRANVNLEHQADAWIAHAVELVGR